MDYEKMLARADDVLVDTSKQQERFVIPNVVGHIEGNKTIISNLAQICNTLGRKMPHFLKFLNKTLATKGNVRGNVVVFMSKIPATKLNEKIKEYADTYVFCKECSKPETELTKKNDVIFLKCKACGAKYAPKSKI